MNTTSAANSPAWLITGESATLEYKQFTAEKERACQMLCAFANGQSGRVLLGVTPAGNANNGTSDNSATQIAPAIIPVRHISLYADFTTLFSLAGRQSAASA